MNDAVQAELAVDPPPEKKVTTADLMMLLRDKYPKDRYALFFDVPDAVGTNQRRRADAIAIGLWNSVGHSVHGFELKISRSDWLREVAKVEKADPFIERCDTWTLVTADAAIAKLEEIPACWGWMSATKNGLRVQRPPQKLRKYDGKIDRLFAVGLFRKLQDDMSSSPEMMHALAAQHAAHVEALERERKGNRDRCGRDLVDLTERVKKFEAVSGIRLDDWRLGNVAALARAMESFRFDGYSSMKARLEGERNISAARIKECEAALEELAKLPTPSPAPGADE